MFERFTDRARRVLVLAQEEARLLAHPYIGTEHLLLGLIQERDGIAAESLDQHGITLEVVRSAVEEATGALTSDPSASPPFTARAKKVLELALRDALELGHSYIGTEHMLLGLLRESEGGGATILLSLGVDFGALREEIIALTSDVSDEGERSQGARREGERGVHYSAHLREEAPNCPRCGADLAEETRYKVVDVPPEDPGVDDVVLSVSVLFCSRCGRAFGTHDLGPGSSS